MTAPPSRADAPDALGRFRRWVAYAVAFAALGWLAYAVWSGFAETADELGHFRWSYAFPVLALTLVNYGLRGFKWHYLLKRLDIRIPWQTNAVFFGAGLAMVISPAKAGEIVKPYLVRAATGAPLERTLPALITERVTDGIAVVALAAIGVSTFYAEGSGALWTTLGAIAAGLGIIASRTLSLGILGLVRRVPVLGAPVADRLTPAYLALRTCVAPGSLAVTLAASLVAWWAECVGYWLVLRGAGVATSLDAATFLYAFSTVAGGPSPGGLGISDTLLGELAQRIAGATPAQGVATSLLIRLATLWFGVALGAVALLRVDAVLPPATAPVAPPPEPPCSSPPSSS